jgi:N-acetylmuramoyl-L-alanine amidase
MPPYQSKPKGGLKMKVMLDAGHYGKTYNPGVVKGYYESEQMWRLQGYLVKALEGYGIKVDTTRKSQSENPGTEERGRRSKGYDLFLSLHTNAPGDNVTKEKWEDYDAPWCFVFQDLSWTNIDDISKGVGNKLGEAIYKTLGTKQPYKIGQQKSPTDRDGNGILDDEYYGVLVGARKVGTPGVLIEHTFHTNKRMCKWLLKEDNLKALAEAEARAIAEYFGIIKQPETVSKKVKITAFALNVRKGPGTNYALSALPLLKGAEVDICEISNGWGRLADGRGWVGLSYTEEVKPETKPVPQPAVNKKVKITADALNIRKGVGTSYPVAGYLKKNDIVEIVEEKDNWGRLADGRGWIGLKYTKEVK